MPDLRNRPVILAAIALLALSAVGSHPAGAQTLKAVKERGTLNCGVSQGLLGFSSQDDKNDWTGFDVDICRAVAAAIFGDPAKVTFMPLDAAARFTALQSEQDRLAVAQLDLDDVAREFARPDVHRRRLL